MRRIDIHKQFGADLHIQIVHQISEAIWRQLRMPIELPVIRGVAVPINDWLKES